MNKKTESKKADESKQSLRTKQRNVVIDEDLFNEIVKDALYNESFSSILRRKWKQSKTDLTSEQSNMGE